ncbi:hypothetical protein QFC19_006837 [Naganishia cerealis]|uniref:Uncharacterized protein n=1 Tax=Naganishia cerealis TaxID=610337 RepID=A0ACC2VDX0_9TREE|nr:hypothetical protein QFC19_006837 [Naganishia cerealis]
MKTTLAFKTLLCAAACFGTAQATFNCRPTFDSKNRKGETKQYFNLEPLSELQTVTKTTETPPTTNEARVSMTLCGDDVLGVDDKIAEEDQASRITAVIPIWSLDTPDSDVNVKPKGRDEGLDITVTGKEYAGYVGYMGHSDLKLN